MYDLAYYKAKEMLQKNRRVLEKIVDELLEFEILTGKVDSEVFRLTNSFDVICVLIQLNPPLFNSSWTE